MKTIIGKIYANWCGHCQSLKPEWNKMKSLIKKDANIQIVEIEENENDKLNQLKKRYPHIQINGYPTIFKIPPNKQIEYYTGDRLAFDMKKWVLEKSKPIITKVVLKNANNKTNKNRNMNNKTNKNKKYLGYFANLKF